VDKAASRSLFVQGSVARELRKAIDEIPDNERDEESIDACSTSTARAPRAPSCCTEIARI
jgi:hypothetical protein